jgi:hypothetical protein
MRNLILLGLVSEPKIHCIAWRRPLGAGLQPKRGGKPTKQTPTLKRNLFKLFEAGATIDGAFEAIGK